MKPTFCYGCKYLEWPGSPERPAYFFCELHEMTKITNPPVACVHYEAPDKPLEESDGGIVK